MFSHLRSIHAAAHRASRIRVSATHLAGRIHHSSTHLTGLAHYAIAHIVRRNNAAGCDVIIVVIGVSKSCPCADSTDYECQRDNS